MPSPPTALIERYAHVAIQVGLNLRAGQRLLIYAPTEAVPLVRALARRAYQSGARFVDVIFEDEDVDLIRFQNAPRDSFTEFNTWLTDALSNYAERGDAFIIIVAKNPNLLEGQDAELIRVAEATRNQYMRPFRELVSENAFNWTLFSLPIPSWAQQVFPNLPPEQHLARLWQVIFHVTRIDQPDPVAAWQAHIRHLTQRADYLNHKNYSALKFTAPGTQLMVGLPRGHRWIGGQQVARNGIAFTPNLPTEEVFTLPDKDRIEGIVTSSRPLHLRGSLIRDFTLTFHEGKAINVTARQGESLLRQQIETDQGAARLGEVALVPASNPIAQSGILFYHTLFDENAATHLALGRAYSFTLDGGEAMPDTDFSAAGGNLSLIHTDFMIGSAEMDVDGVFQDGRVEPLMRRGDWCQNGE